MEVLHVEDLANHDDPESCVVIREGGGEALTVESVGRALSRVKLTSRVPTLWRKAEGNMVRCAKASTSPALRGLRPLARTETTCSGTGRSLGRPLSHVWQRPASGRAHP
jgi:RNA-directed DNA polymerase